MNEYVPQKIGVIVEGFRQDKSEYIYHALRCFFGPLGLVLHHVNLEGLSMSLLNPHYKGASPTELQCKESFAHLSSLISSEAENFVLVCDTLTESYEKRGDFFSADYSVDSNSVFILEKKEVPEPRPALGIVHKDEGVVREISNRFSKISVDVQESWIEPSLPCIQPLKEQISHMKKKYMERICVLVGEIKKRAVMYKQVKIFQGIYLHSRYSTMSFLNTGYTLFYMEHTPVLSVLTKILSKLVVKKKWVVYFCGYQKSEAEKRETPKTLRHEEKFRRGMKTFCEREKIGAVIYSDAFAKGVAQEMEEVVKIEAPSLALDGRNGTRDLSESMLLVEGLEKTLVILPASSAKILISYVKRLWAEENFSQSVPQHTVIRISVKGTEIEEKKFPIVQAD